MKIRLRESQAKIINILRESESQTSDFRKFVEVNEGKVDDMWSNLMSMSMSDILGDESRLGEYQTVLDEIETASSKMISHKEGVLSNITANKGTDAAMKVDVYIDNMFTVLNRKVRVFQQLLVKLMSFSGDDDLASAFSGVVRK